MEIVAPHNLRLDWARNFTMFITASHLSHLILHITSFTSFDGECLRSEKVITCLLSERNVSSEMLNVLLLL